MLNVVDVYVGNLRIHLIAVQSGINCHCRDCQKSTGSGKATIVFVLKQAFSVKSELKYFSVTGADESVVERGFVNSVARQLIAICPVLNRI